MAEDNSYEEQRRRQVEENRRKLDELRLHRLSAAVREAAAGPLPVRSAATSGFSSSNPSSCSRSSSCRFTRLVFVGIAEDQAAEAAEGATAAGCSHLAVRPSRQPPQAARLPRHPGRASLKGNLPDRVYATDEKRAYTITKAEELADKLASDYPTFVKPITHYYATSSWLAILPQFSKKYLPWCDEMIILVDEEDAEFHMLYHAHSGGIGNGWRQFAIGHKLADSDCLVFQLVERTKFKVYITTASSYYENDHC